MFRKLLSLAVLYALFTTPALAKNYVVNVHGIVCEFCSFGVARNVKKLPFIDGSQYKDGVKVKIENQMVFVAVRDDATLDKDALFDAIESGGYKPVKIWLITESGEHKEVK